jgi:hypothetical protein
MERKKVFATGGFIASFVLVGIGIAAAIIGYNGREEVRDALREENIVAPADSSIPGQLVDTGAEAKAQAEIMRHHQLESSQGLTYAEMGRFATPDGNPKGTNDAAAALKDDKGNPVANSVRNTWVTETALTTSLNTAYFAEQVGLFSMVMGLALILGGIGFAVLTAGTLWQPAIHLPALHRDGEPDAKAGRS